MSVSNWVRFGIRRGGRAGGFAGACRKVGLVWLLALVSCGREGEGERSFTVRGVVRDFPSDGKTLVVRHEEIPGYMPKMTMDLTLADTNEVRGLALGDSIEFRLVARAEDHFIDRIRKLTGGGEAGVITNVPVVAETAGAEAAGSRSRMAELKVGDEVPVLRMVSEDGKDLTLSELRGRAVAMTFFFTRCPLPDFCPRMNRNFAEARERLRRDSQGPKNWTFVSLSFDPEFDSPVVLKGYAKAYRGANPEGWMFATVGPGALEVIRGGFDLKLTRDGGGYSHNLRTVVVDAGGRVFRLFDGNRWTVAELAEAMAAAARVGGGAAAGTSGK